jgi:uncharacterized protein (TIGR04255 family)
MLLALKAAFEDEYPRIEEQKAAQVALRAQPNFSATATELGLRGILLRSQDGLDVVQCRLDGFTYNRLKPYTQWEDILPKALAAWEKFVEITAPTTVSRVAVRYINHIPIPGTSQDAIAAVTTGLQLPQEFSGSLKHYTFNAQLSHADGQMNVNLVQAIETNIAPDTYTVLLDIDAYRASETDLPLDSAGLAREFEKLRRYKNQIFFAALTEATTDRLT